MQQSRIAKPQNIETADQLQKQKTLALLNFIPLMPSGVGQSFTYSKYVYTNETRFFFIFLSCVKKIV